MQFARYEACIAEEPLRAELARLQDEWFLTPRQAEAVDRALNAVRAAHEALTAGLTPDVVLTEAEGALDALGELTGRTAREDMVTRIFERFCVGK